MSRMSVCREQGCARAPPICRHRVAFMLVNSILVLYNKYHGMNKKAGCRRLASPTALCRRRYLPHSSIILRTFILLDFFL